MHIAFHKIWIHMHSAHFAVEINVFIVVVVLLPLPLIMMMMFAVTTTMMMMMLCASADCGWTVLIHTVTSKPNSPEIINTASIRHIHTIYMFVWLVYNWIICIQTTLHLIKSWYIVVDTIHYSNFEIAVIAIYIEMNKMNLKCKISDQNECPHRHSLLFKHQLSCLGLFSNPNLIYQYQGHTVRNHTDILTLQ